MSDIVEQLRDGHVRFGTETIDDAKKRWLAARYEAADEIERLRQQNESHQAALGAISTLLSSQTSAVAMSIKAIADIELQTPPEDISPGDAPVWHWKDDPGNWFCNECGSPAMRGHYVGCSNMTEAPKEPPVSGGRW